jgi:hypothetical protein
MWQSFSDYQAFFRYDKHVFVASLSQNEGGVYPIVLPDVSGPGD